MYLEITSYAISPWPNFNLLLYSLCNEHRWNLFMWLVSETSIITRIVSIELVCVVEFGEMCMRGRIQRLFFYLGGGGGGYCHQCHMSPCCNSRHGL